MEFPGLENNILQLNDLVFKIQRSKRKSLALVVERDGNLKIKAPVDCPNKDIQRFLKKKNLLLYEKLGQKEKFARKKAATKEFVPGEGFLFLGQSYRLRLVNPGDVNRGSEFRVFQLVPDASPNLQCNKNSNGSRRSKTPPLVMREGWFELLASEAERGREHFINWYKTKGLEWIQEDLEYYSRRVGVARPKVRIRELGYRWGSCSRKGVINLNWRIFMAPPVVVRYVLVHELVHLLEPRHNKAFWERVEMAMPEYRERKHWLDENGASLDI
ncbi:MAG: M48 family metallopeptidase [Peptococcaceae bacterium]|nr:M48 family metallopeptidase [Peptococcaceae bacterium]